MNHLPAATAHHCWKAGWRKAVGSSPWTMPEPWAIDHASSLSPGSRILDLGAGIGRHALTFAAPGHDVTAPDAAEAATEAIAAAALTRERAVRTTGAGMTDLPFRTACFDHVAAWKVICHGDEAVVRRTPALVARVLRPGCGFLATMPSACRLPVEQARAKGRETSRNTGVFAGKGDGFRPHCFCTAPEVLLRLRGLEVLTLFDRPHVRPGSWDRHFPAEHLA